MGCSAGACLITRRICRRTPPEGGPARRKAAPLACACSGTPACLRLFGNPRSPAPVRHAAREDFLGASVVFLLTSRLPCRNTPPAVGERTSRNKRAHTAGAPTGAEFIWARCSHARSPPTQQQAAIRPGVIGASPFAPCLSSSGSSCLACWSELLRPAVGGGRYPTHRPPPALS